MQYLVKVTNQLTPQDWEQLRDLFNDSFQREATIEWFQRKYRSPLSSISCYHGLMLNEDSSIVGAMTIIPFEYNFFGQIVAIGNLVDLMIHKKHRNNILNFKFIYEKLVVSAAPLIHFIYAVPNPNSFLYFMKVLKWEEIGRLDYYLWPVKVSKLSKMPAALDYIFGPVMNSVQHVFRPLKNNPILSPIRKVMSSAYVSYRYSKDYQIITVGSKMAWYRVYDEKGVKTAYLIDALPMETQWLSFAIREILKREKSAIDLIMYISNSNLGIWNILKAPLRYQPRPLPLIGKLINTEKIDERIFNMNNWTFNLSDFDVR